MEPILHSKYFGVLLDNKLEWLSHMETVYETGQNRLYFLRRWQSFNMCKLFSCSFYKTVVASALFLVLCAGGLGACTSDRSRLNKTDLKKKNIYPLNALKVFQHSSFTSSRLIPSRSKAECYSSISVLPPVNSLNRNNCLFLFFFCAILKH